MYISRRVMINAHSVLAGWYEVVNVRNLWRKRRHRGRSWGLSEHRIAQRQSIGCARISAVLALVQPCHHSNVKSVRNEPISWKVNDECLQDCAFDYWYGLTSNKVSCEWYGLFYGCTVQPLDYTADIQFAFPHGCTYTFFCTRKRRTFSLKSKVTQS